MRALVNGIWHAGISREDEILDQLKASVDGFHHRVTRTGASEFPAEKGRYHLYVSYACPWAHRTIIYRKLKKLEDVVSMSVLHPRWANAEGWRFGDTPYSTVDHAAGKSFLHENYRMSKPDYTGRVTVPVLWDRKTSTIVNNESSQIIRMLNSEFDEWGDASVDFYPEALRTQIDEINSWLIPEVCAGVYRAGFAATQDAYNDAVKRLFAKLDVLEDKLSAQPYLCGDRLTECDWHLFTLLCRFDAVYYGALRCNLRHLIDYPALTRYTGRMHAISGVAETVRFDHIKLHYYDAIDEIDHSIVPLGPLKDYTSHPLAAE